jgi:hypothetical protein
MTIIKVGLDPKKTTQWRKAKDLSSGIISTTATQYWHVQFSAAQSDPSQCYGASDGTNTVPVIGDAYPTDGTLTVIDVNPQQVTQAATMYSVQVQFSTRTSSGETGKWDTKVTFDGEPVQVTAYYDINNKPITNSAKQNFASQPVETFYDGKLSISFKTDTFDETSCEPLRGCSNTEVITLVISALSYSHSFAADTLRLDDYTAEPVVQLGTVAYWNVSLHFTQRNQITSPANSADAGALVSGFKMYLVDAGYCEIGTPPVAIKDSDGNLLNTPHYLDGSGHKTNTPYFLDFVMVKSADLSALFTGIS